MGVYTKAMDRLINELGRLPGIGSKTAERLAFHILSSSKDDAQNLADAISEVKRTIGYCRECFNLSESERCNICSESGRDRQIICVVEEPKDIIYIERAGHYNGLYHVLLGALSPLEGIGPDDLKMKELLIRIERLAVEEVILATNSDTEGEATALYLMSILKPLKLKVTRIAYGIPVGGTLEYADQVTLARSFEGRHQLL